MLYIELWPGNLPLTPFDVPETLTRIERKHCEIGTVVGRSGSKESVILTLVDKRLKTTSL